jgi:hypothetical protein
VATAPKAAATKIHPIVLEVTMIGSAPGTLECKRSASRISAGQAFVLLLYEAEASHMASNNQNRNSQNQDQNPRRQEQDQDERIRQGRSADDRDSEPKQGGSASRSDQAEDEADDLDDEDRDDDMRSPGEGGKNRRS